MADVSESGAWTGEKRGPLIAAAGGYTNFQEGDVLLAKITPCLENGKGAHAVGLCNGYGYGSTEFHVLRAKGSVSARYLFYVTQHKEFRLKAEMQMTGTAGQRRVPTDFFDRYCANVPSKAEQSKIAEILDTLDAAIRGTEAVVAKLKAMKLGLLHDLLTRGIDANGDLRPPQPEAPHLYKQTPLGWLPKEWDAVPLATACSLIKDGTHLPPRRVDEGPFLLSVRNMVDGKFVLTNQDTRVSEDFFQLMHRSWEVLENDVLLAIVGATIGKVAKVGRMPKFTLQRSVAVLRGAKDLLSNQFLAEYLGSSFFQKALWRAVNQTAQPGIYLAELGRLIVPTPPATEQIRLIEILDEADEKIHAELDLLSKLRLLKSGLMDDLLTGRTPVAPLL